MQTIKTLIQKNKTIQMMLLDTQNSYQKKGALEQLRLDSGLTNNYIYEHYFEVINFCKCINL